MRSIGRLTVVSVLTLSVGLAVTVSAQHGVRAGLHAIGLKGMLLSQTIPFLAVR
jgi:hypothetical protein